MDFVDWIDQTTALRVTTTLMHFLWQGLLGGAFVLLSGWLFQNAKPQFRYLVNVAVMLSMAACLPATFYLVNEQSKFETASFVRVDSQQNEQLDDADLANGGSPAIASSTTDTEVSLSESVDGRLVESKPSAENVVVARQTLSRETEGDDEQTAVESPSAATWIAPIIVPLAPYITSLYFCCVVIMLLRVMVGIRGGQRLRAFAVPLQDASLLKNFEAQVQRIGLRVKPAIGWCDEISIPIVVGILIPMVLLPASLASGLTPNQLNALIAHELAHLRRFDLLVNLLQRCIEALLFFHPAVWFVSKQISVERELATDDLVLNAGWQPTQYADALVRMAELSAVLRDSRHTVHSTALAASGNRTGELKRRVLRILKSDSAPQFRLNPVAFRLFAIALISILMLPFVVPVLQPTVAQDQGNEVSDGETIGRVRQICHHWVCPAQSTSLTRRRELW